jgi:hypothetical protein
VSEPIRVELNFSGDDSAIDRIVREAIRRHPIPSGTVREEPPNWVLVKGYHDSGTIDGVYGPYTEAHADWLLSDLLSNAYGNWTKVKLASGPENADAHA